MNHAGVRLTVKFYYVSESTGLSLVLTLQGLRSTTIESGQLAELIDEHRIELPDNFPESNDFRRMTDEEIKEYEADNQSVESDDEEED